MKTVIQRYPDSHSTISFLRFVKDNAIELVSLMTVMRQEKLTLRDIERIWNTHMIKLVLM